MSNRWLCVVAAYCPCLSQEPNSFYQQQLWNFAPSKPEPRQSFLSDLHQELTSWIAEGDAILVMLDANSSVLSGPLPAMFHSLSMVNLHFCDRHDL